MYIKTIIISCLISLATPKLIVESSKNCVAKNNYVFKYNATLGFLPDGTQYLNSTVKVLRDIGNEVRGVTVVELARSKKANRFITIYNLKTEKGCQDMHNILGELLVSIERAGGLEPRKCPFKAGNYVLTKFPMDLSMINMNFPKGVLKVTINGYNKSDNNAVVTCLRVIIKSV